MDYKRMGSNLRAARMARGLTQGELARMAGISLPFYGNVERGMRRPSLETVCRLAMALEVPVDALLGLEVAAGACAGKDVLRAACMALESALARLRELEKS